jgi:hypothetical protein
VSHGDDESCQGSTSPSRVARVDRTAVELDGQFGQHRHPFGAPRRRWRSGGPYRDFGSSFHDLDRRAPLGNASACLALDRPVAPSASCGRRPARPYLGRRRARNEHGGSLSGWLRLGLAQPLARSPPCFAVHVLAPHHGPTQFRHDEYCRQITQVADPGRLDSRVSQ